MALREMNVEKLGSDHPTAHKAFLESKLKGSDGFREWHGMPDSLSDWAFHDGFREPVPGGTVVGERTAYGPREPSIVWTGERWICSEMDLSVQERSLMDSVADQCPGGLGGWS